MGGSRRKMNPHFSILARANFRKKNDEEATEMTALSFTIVLLRQFKSHHDAFLIFLFCVHLYDIFVIIIYLFFTYRRFPRKHKSCQSFFRPPSLAFASARRLNRSTHVKVGLFVPSIQTTHSSLMAFSLSLSLFLLLSLSSSHDFISRFRDSQILPALRLIAATCTTIAAITYDTALLQPPSLFGPLPISFSEEICVL